MSCFHYLITDVPGILQPFTQDLMKLLNDRHGRYFSLFVSMSFLYPQVRKLWI